MIEYKTKKLKSGDIMKKIFMEKYDIESGLNFDYCDNFYKIDLINDNWKFYYSLAKKYYEYHGDLVIPISFRTKNGYDYDDTGIRLGNWISRQRTAYKDPKKSKISIEQIKLLKEIGMIFDAQSYAWLKNYNLAESYYEYHGNLEIPASFKTKDGYNFDEQGINLGIWINHQREAYKSKGKNKLTNNQIKLLKKIGMIFDVHNDTWVRNYNLAKAYYEYYGNLEIVDNFKTKNGYEYDKSGISLGRWIRYQRKNYSTHELNEYQIILLNNIGMLFDIRSNNWLKNYNLAKKYYEHHGNLQIAQNFKTINGYEYDELGTNLGRWIDTQRLAYKEQENFKINSEQIKLLEKIGMIFVDVNFEKWKKNYNLAKSYYEHYKNLQVSCNFKTINGYEYDEHGINLGRWISNQRQAYTGNGTSRINYEQIRLLEEIGMIWFDENKNQKLQNEIINEQNKKKKQIEILNRVRSYLNTLDENKVYSKEEINSGFVKKLSR